MPQIRPELMKGLAVLGIFIVLMVSTDLVYPYSFNQSGYTVVGIKRLSENPLPLEGFDISSSATVVSVTDNGSYYSAEVAEGVILVFPVFLDSPIAGQRVLFRGTSWFHSNGSILVHEFQVTDSSSSLIRSVPGIVIFIVLFFMTFRVDFNRLAFIPKKGGDEDT